jgi:catechol 2,3-dioxygenase
VTHAPFPPSVWIGHGQLHVADLERATAFYSDVLGFTVRAYALTVGLHAVFLAARDRHIALSTWLGKGGLQHLAVLYPNREALIEAVCHVIAHSHAIDDARDHGVSVAVYLRDPEENGVELYYERPRSEWHVTNGRPGLKNDRIHVDELLTDPRAA